MKERTLRKKLTDLPLGGFRFFDQTGSTNDIALAWVSEGAPDLGLVYAEGQTSGRGRGSRRWFSPPGAGLAFSLVLRLGQEQKEILPLYSGLGGVAVCQALEGLDMQPEIKWPNDVLLNRRKVCGILAEAVWVGEVVEAVVLGIGLNVTAASVPPPAALNYPATCLEQEAGRPVDRLGLLKAVLFAVIAWRDRIGSEAFHQRWEGSLAFRQERVYIQQDGQADLQGEIEGLGADGSLRVRASNGREHRLHFGEVHLRPIL
jgi:BirA family biotin operon repressor/biotin-[acetyl-CoA-carboxylase] ligase